MSTLTKIYKTGFVFFVGAAYSKIKHNTKTQMDFEELMDRHDLPSDEVTALGVSLVSSALWPIALLFRLSPGLSDSMSNWVSENIEFTEDEEDDDED